MRALRRLVRAAAGAGIVMSLAACRQDMHDQPKYEPLEASDFFADGRASRPLVEGTVARGQLARNDALDTGQAGGQAVTELPLPVDRALLDRGRERYDIYCAPCHDRVGTGEGMIVQRGFRQPPSFHIDRLRQAPPGHFYDVMTNGFGAMPDYRAQTTVHDRWAIVADIRALQLSQYARLEELPEIDRARIDETPGAPPASEPGEAPDEDREP